MLEIETEFERRALALFDAMLDAAPADQDAWLETQTDCDYHLITAVRALIAADRAGGLLPTLPPELQGPELPPPARIGAYRIIEELGRGGMGVVFLAERDDGLFEHRVAIKLIGNTVFSATALERFATERRILARLRHPHIAQMLDGGITCDGASYIIMELIDGTPITDHCSEHDLPREEGIGLFRQAMAAVEHAHRNLIVHADIKASNVVVERGFGVKLLDFGIARLLTEADDRIGKAYTPGHASPAQMEGLAPVPLDDVFASGVLLRRLVADGRDDPDLLAIVAKATATDAEARYGSITELDQDVARWQMHRPLAARPPTRWRRATLYWRRHRLGLTIAAAAALLLFGTIGATTTLWLRAERARTDAEARFDETRAMANYMLSEVDPELAGLPGTLPLRRRLVSRGRDYLQSLERGRNVAPSLDLDIASGYLQLARIYGFDVSGGLGDLAAAQASLAHADRLLAAAARRGDGGLALLRLSAEEHLVAASQVFVLADNARLEQGTHDANTAAALFTAYLRHLPDDIDARLSLWQAQIMPARAQVYRGDVSKIPQLLLPTLKNGEMPVRTISQRSRRDFLLNGAYLMLAESQSGENPRGAYHYYKLLNDDVDRMQAAGISNLNSDFIQATARAAMGEIRYTEGDLSNAVKDYRAAIASMDRLLAAGPNQDISFNRRMVTLRLAVALAKTGAISRARALIGQVVARSARTGNVNFDARWMALVDSAESQVEELGGEKSKACRTAEVALHQWNEVSRIGAAMSIDTAAGGPIDSARTRLRLYCG